MEEAETDVILNKKDSDFLTPNMSLPSLPSATFQRQSQRA